MRFSRRSSLLSRCSNLFISPGLALAFWETIVPRFLYVASAAYLDFGYVAVKDTSSSSSFLCALMTSPDSYVTVTVARSSIDCARQCTRNSDNCVGFNYHQNTKTCQQFDKVQSDLAWRRGCIYYTADNAPISCIIDHSGDVNRTITPAQNCSFPFTYNGQLYYNCIQNVTGVTQCDQYACLMTGRVWAICSSSTDYQIQNITANIVIPTLAGTTPAMEVNDWIVFQQKIDDSLDWYLTWADYKNGFGALGGNYWMGNEKVSLLTNSEKYKLRMEMMSCTMGWVSAEYGSFYLGNEADLYRLHVADYSGDSGDCLMYNDTWSETYYVHNTMHFTTKDSDNDMLPWQNCADMRLSGWWFNRCQWVNLNGIGGCSSSSYFYVWTVPDPSVNAYLAASRLMMKRTT